MRVSFIHLVTLTAGNSIPPRVDHSNQNLDPYFWIATFEVSYTSLILAEWSMELYAYVSLSKHLGLYRCHEFISLRYTVRRITLKQLTETGSVQVLLRNFAFFLSSGGYCWYWKNKTTLLTKGAHFLSI